MSGTLGQPGALRWDCSSPLEMAGLNYQGQIALCANISRSIGAITYELCPGLEVACSSLDSQDPGLNPVTVGWPRGSVRNFRPLQ